MNSQPNKKEQERIRTQMECVDESAIELMKSGVEADSELAELFNWLRDSEQNQIQLAKIQKANQNIRAATLEVPEMDPNLITQIKSAVSQDQTAYSANPDSSQTEIEASADDYQELFDETDRIRSELLSGSRHEQNAKGSQSPNQQSPNQWDDDNQNIDDEKVAKSANDLRTTRRQFANWWIGAVATVGTITATIAAIVMFAPSPTENSTEFTAEMLCTESLTWNPNATDDPWSSDVAKAPQDRLFPNHLIRLQAQSWKPMEIDGDKNGVVYNLIPNGHLSELKAYVYVFKSDKDYQLPNQFDSHPTSNRRYKFWSVSCQQDLVFVLVFEGDEKRLHDLIKVQQVG